MSSFYNYFYNYFSNYYGTFGKYFAYPEYGTFTVKFEYKQSILMQNE